MRSLRPVKLLCGQRGAVAIIVALSIFILVGMLALVIDLGHLYIAKAGLQNGADAAALAGAKELDGTQAGINRAVTRAIDIARQNQYALTRDNVGTTDTDGGVDIYVGSSPFDADMIQVSPPVPPAAVAAGDKTFLKVHTRQRSIGTWFAGVFDIFGSNPYVGATKAFGMAVAGRYVIDVAPLAICQLRDDPANAYDNEFGYERGVSYRMSDANPLGPGTMYWIDPQAQTAGSCTGNTPASLPYLCTGKMAFTPQVGQNVYTNTGISDPQLEALDSRFDVFNSKNKCDPSTAPPDTNIKEYRYTDNSTGSPKQWMNPDPGQQSITFATVNVSGSNIYMPVPRGAWTDNKGKAGTPRTYSNYGVLWSFSRPKNATTSQWPTLYGGAVSNYPETAPYVQGNTSPYFQAPTHTGKANRRVLNVSIVDCRTLGGICRPATVLGIGQFFMTRMANVPSDKNIYLEFGGLLPNPLPAADIRLYR